MKGDIQPGHIATNDYELLFPTLPPLTPTSIGGLEEELDTVELPDRTKASGGDTRAVETDVAIPAHHHIEIAAMEKWYRECQDPVAPTYKKVGTLVIKSHVTGALPRTIALFGVFITKRATPDLEKGNEGEEVDYTYTLSIDRILPA
jgi:hypothetical protein